MTCSNHASCQLFPQFAMDPSLKIWQQHFCEGKYKSCVRYQNSVEGKPVPLTLLPNGKVLHKVRNKEEMAGTALFNAIYKGRVPMVKSMLRTKVSSTAITGPDGMTPLMAAASVGNLELTKLFLDFGCNPFNKKDDGKQAIDIAQEGNYAECVQAIQDYMNAHPEQQVHAQTVSKQKTDVSEDEEESMSSVVGFLRKLNPFARNNL